jgi:hypothetical protein
MDVINKVISGNNRQMRSLLSRLFVFRPYKIKNEVTSDVLIWEVYTRIMKLINHKLSCFIVVVSELTLTHVDITMQQVAAAK